MNGAKIIARLIDVVPINFTIAISACSYYLTLLLFQNGPSITSSLQVFIDPLPVHAQQRPAYQE
jgi:hypothetical protein